MGERVSRAERRTSACVAAAAALAACQDRALSIVPAVSVAREPTVDSASWSPSNPTTPVIFPATRRQRTYTFEGGSS